MYHEDDEPKLGPCGTPWVWVCINGCGECQPKLVAYRHFVSYDAVTNEISEERSVPRMVSHCCGESMYLYDTEKDEEGPTGYDGSLENTKESS
jgi:hypothetical protein